MNKQSTPFSNSRPYMKNYFSLIKEYEKNKATLLKEEPKKPIVKIIEDIYNKYSSNLESYMHKNKGKLQLYGSTKYENASIEAFITELQSYKSAILKQIKTNPLVSANMNHQFPSEDIILTPLPDKPRKLLKEKKEKAEFDSAERTAVVMRVVEYTHRLRKENKSVNASNNGLKVQKESNDNDNKAVFIVIRKAVNVIQLWWKGIRKEKIRNIRANRFNWLVKLYIKRRVFNWIRAIDKKKLKKKVNIIVVERVIDKLSDMDILIEGKKKVIKNPLMIIRNKGNVKDSSVITKLIYQSKAIESQMKMIYLLNRMIKQWMIKKCKKTKAKVKVIMKCYKKPNALIGYNDKVFYSLSHLIMLQLYILRFLSRRKLSQLRKQALFKTIKISKVLPQITSKTILYKTSEVIQIRNRSQICFITKHINDIIYHKVLLPLCSISKSISLLTLNKEIKESNDIIEIIYKKPLCINICYMSKKIKESTALIPKDLISYCFMTKETKSILHVFKKELISISFITKEYKSNKVIQKRDLAQSCFITKQRQIYIPPITESNQIPLSIIKLNPIILFKVTKYNEVIKPIQLSKSLYTQCYYYSKERRALSTKSLNINIGVNTDTIIQSNSYHITKEYQYSYKNNSALIHSLSYIINNHCNEHFIKAFKQYTTEINKRHLLSKIIKFQEEHNYTNSLLHYFKQWQYHLSVYTYSLAKELDQSAIYTHNFEYKSIVSNKKPKTNKQNLYRLSLGLKLLIDLFYKSPYCKLKSKSFEDKCNRFIHLITKKNNKELLYCLILNNLQLENIDINRKQIITLINYGFNNQYLNRLKEILQLNITENNYSDINLSFNNYLRQLIEVKEEEEVKDLDGSLTERESLSGNESNDIPDEINQIYLCRNKNLNKKCITSPDTSDNEDRRLRQLNNYDDNMIFTPVKSANKKQQYTNGKSKRIYPKISHSPRTDIVIIRDMNAIDLSII